MHQEPTAIRARRTRLGKSIHQAYSGRPHCDVNVLTRIQRGKSDVRLAAWRRQTWLAARLAPRMEA